VSENNFDEKEIGLVAPVVKKATLAM